MTHYLNNYATKAIRKTVITTMLIAQPVYATTGWGCFQVINVPSGDVLNLRAGPSANSRIVDRLAPGQHGIIVENGACRPANKPPSKQWCPVRHIGGSPVAKKGWGRLRYLAPSECP